MDSAPKVQKIPSLIYPLAVIACGQRNSTTESEVARKDILLSDQLERRKNWKDPLVAAAVATVLYRERMDYSTRDFLDGVEVLVTQRKKGAELDQFQAHHGGFLKPSDRDIYEGAAREVLEETGYRIDPNTELRYVTSVGPALYRSELSVAADSGRFGISRRSKFMLRISEDEAEPAVAFALPIFLASADGKTPAVETDGEVAHAVWMTPRALISRFGSKGSRPYSEFNYFQILVPALLSMIGEWKPGKRAVTLPGTYVFSAG